MMGYEGQIAGIGDNVPGKAISNLVVRAMKSASARDVAERRAEIVTALSEVSQLEFVNGGGTGSIELTAAEWAVTEVAAGSGFYAPVLSDHYQAFRPRPAAMFALPVARGSGVAPSVAWRARPALPGGGANGLADRRSASTSVTSRRVSSASDSTGSSSSPGRRSGTNFGPTEARARASFESCGQISLVRASRYRIEAFPGG